MFTRHAVPNKAYQITREMRDAFESLKLPPGKFHVFDGELLHNKTSNIKDRIVLYDLLVLNGEYLVGTTYISRYRKLQMLLGRPGMFETDTSHRIAYRVNRNIWLAKVYTKDIAERFKKLLHLPEIEGLVLKDPTGKLDYGLTEENNGSWLTRVRKPNKNYSY
jgi:ATP-dependent DNA ligase